MAARPRLRVRTGTRAEPCCESATHASHASRSSRRVSASGEQCRRPGARAARCFCVVVWLAAAYSITPQGFHHARRQASCCGACEQLEAHRAPKPVFKSHTPQHSPALAASLSASDKQTDAFSVTELCLEFALAAKEHAAELAVRAGRCHTLRRRPWRVRGQEHAHAHPARVFAERNRTEQQHWQHSRCDCPLSARRRVL